MPELIALSESRAGPRCDNISVLAIDWHDKAVPAPEEPLTVPMENTRTDMSDLIATDPNALRMSDAEMERQIAEIKKALIKNEPVKK